VNETGETRVETSARVRRDPAGFVVAGLLALVAIVLVVDANGFQNTSAYGMGPKVVPYMIACGLGVLALGNLVMGWRDDFPRRENIDLRAVWMILGGIVALIAIIGLGGGFIVATAILFATTATAFGRRAIMVDLLIGFVLATVIYFAFAKLLALSLPAGPLERLF
jgi:putative tricarboxylic transport membrane protein